MPKDKHTHLWCTKDTQFGVKMKKSFEDKYWPHPWEINKYSHKQVVTVQYKSKILCFWFEKRWHSRLAALCLWLSENGSSPDLKGTDFITFECNTPRKLWGYEVSLLLDCQTLLKRKFVHSAGEKLPWSISSGNFARWNSSTQNMTVSIDVHVSLSNSFVCVKIWSEGTEESQSHMRLDKVHKMWTTQCHRIPQKDKKRQLMSSGVNYWPREVRSDRSRHTEVNTQ